MKAAPLYRTRKALLPLRGRRWPEGPDEGSEAKDRSGWESSRRVAANNHSHKPRRPHPGLRPTFSRAAGEGLWAPVLTLALALSFPALAQSPLLPYTVTGDAISASLTSAPGDPARGRAIALNRQVGLCILCHSGPFPEERFQGTLAPDMKGAGARWNEGQLRLRIVDASRLNPDTIMPPYYRIDGFTRVATAFAGKPLLNAEQIEDVVAFLTTLKE